MCVVLIVASVSVLTVYPHIDITDSFRFAAMCITRLFGLKIFKNSSTALTFKRDHRIDNSKELVTTALHVTEVFKNLLSIAHWAVEFVMKRYRDITPFIKPCHTLTLGPDYIIPQDLHADDNMAAYETPRSTVVDGDDSMSWSSTSSELGDAATTTHVVRKKRTGFCFCAKSANSYKAVSEDPDDISNCINRRKGIPQRSPLYNGDATTRDKHAWWVKDNRNLTSADVPEKHQYIGYK
ncbi:hypothetical protein Bca4012_041672 [Brassica carinata]